MPRARNDFAELERRIGYHFFDPMLLERALTHSTAREGRQADDNRRLAFLGDAVLELAIREACFQSAPLSPRGDLSADADRFVPDAEVAERARDLDIGAWLDVGKGEANNHLGADRRLADALEALAGAIYSEAGHHAFRVVRHLMRPGEDGGEPRGTSIVAT